MDKVVTISDFLTSPKNTNKSKEFVNVKAYFYGTIVLSLFIIILYSYWVAERIRKPLQSITKSLNKMTLGNYGTRS
ncbi:hypothetical protein [Peribacillus butanolivorans]